jgi:hypothetical protein
MGQDLASAQERCSLAIGLVQSVANPSREWRWLCFLTSVHPTGLLTAATRHDAINTEGLAGCLFAVLALQCDALFRGEKKSAEPW